MALIAVAFHYFCLVSGILCALSLVLYLLPLVYLSLFACNQDLRKKYNASWALVTGGSSGIGKAVVQNLAKQVRSPFFPVYRL